MPEDVAALVTAIDVASVTVKLLNLSATVQRSLVIQADGLREHRFTQIEYTVTDAIAPIPTPIGRNTRPLATSSTNQKLDVKDKVVRIALPPLTQTQLHIGLERYVDTPTYYYEWAQLILDDPVRY